MGVTSLFHDALIHSIVEITKENENIAIFDFIKLMISETNWILSPGERDFGDEPIAKYVKKHIDCLLYTSPSPRDLSTSRMPSSA